MKKTIALLLAVMLCLGLFAACQSSSLEAYSETDISDTGDDAAAETTDYTPCFKSYKPDQVMMTINGIDITWRELFYWYYYDVSSIEHYYGAITDWEDTTLFNGEQSFREYILNNGLETVKHYAALESKAAEMGIELSDEDKASIEQRWTDNVANYGNGDEQEFIDYLESLFLDKDLYNHINEISALYDGLLTETYGENGSKLTEEDIISGAEDLGYARAKHIFLSFTDADGNTITDEEKASKKAQLQKILDELLAITDPAAQEAKIDEYAASVSEDTGKDYYLDGYTFLPDSLDAAFEAGTYAVEENQVNPEIIESSMGYHVIMRLPLTTTAIVEYSSETEYTTLASIVPDGMFEALVDDWASEATVEYSKAYEKMDIAEVFGKATTGEQADETAAGGVEWYVIVIIVLLVAVIAVGIVLIIQHEKASRAAEAEAEAVPDEEPESDEEAEEPKAEEAPTEEAPSEEAPAEEKPEAEDKTEE